MHRQLLQALLQACPVKTGAGVLLAAWGNVFMPGNVGDGVVGSQGLAQLLQGLVLGGIKLPAFQTFELNANRKIIAVAAPAPLRCARVPSAVVAAHKLPHHALACDEEVGRNLQPPNALKVGVGIPVELVGEELLHAARAIFTRRQADGVQYGKSDAASVRARAEVGGGEVLGDREPAVLPSGRGCVSGRRHTAHCRWMARPLRATVEFAAVQCGSAFGAS